MQHGRTFVAPEHHGTPTAAFVKNADWQFPRRQLRDARCAPASATVCGRRLRCQARPPATAGRQHLHQPAAALRLAAGAHPLSHAALMRAIELNGVQVENNQARLRMGPRCARTTSPRCRRCLRRGAGHRVRQEAVAGRDWSLSARVPHRLPGRGLRGRIQAFVDKVRLQAEAKLGQSKALSEAVARYLFKLMAYKDEYEVARLHTDPAFWRRSAMFEGDYKAGAPPGAAADRPAQRTRANW